MLGRINDVAEVPERVPHANSRLAEQYCNTCRAGGESAPAPVRYPGRGLWLWSSPAKEKGGGLSRKGVEFGNTCSAPFWTWSPGRIIIVISRELVMG